MSDGNGDKQPDDRTVETWLDKKLKRGGMTVKEKRELRRSERQGRRD